MPLTLKSPWQLLGRVRRGSGSEDSARASSTSTGASGGGAASSSSASAPWFTSSASGGGNGAVSASAPRKDSKSSNPSVEYVTTKSGAQAFRVQVPQGAKPGDSLRFRAPDGRLVEIDLPAGCVPGRKVTIEVEQEDDWRRTLSDLTSVVKTNFEATQASCNSMRERLREELELQRGLWASASSTPQTLFDLDYGRKPQETTLATSGAADLSQTQALVFACAEAGDGKQLLAALAEARSFSTVSLSLEECVRTLNSAEEAMITWRCLLDSLQAENRHEIEVWVEEARSLGLEAPSGLQGLLGELQRREEESLKQYAKVKEAEEQVKFAMEAGDPELLAEVVAQAESMGAKGLFMQQATARVRQQQMQREAEAAAGLGPRIAQPQKPAPPVPPPAPVGGQWLPKPKVSAEGLPQRQSSFNNGGSGGATSSSSRAGGAEAGAGPSPGSRPSAPSSTPYGQTSKAPDDGKSVKELIEDCKRLGIDTTGCTDGDDLRRLLISGRAKEQSRPSQPQGFVKQVPASQAHQAGIDGLTVWARQHPPPQYATKRSKSLYLLGLDPHRNPAPAELRSAYRKTAMECHPDRAQNHSRQDQAKDLFQKVKEAFDFLSS